MTNRASQKYQYSLKKMQSWEPLDFFFYWMYERERIWALRRIAPSDPKSWTNDPIFQDYRFCNVFREKDTVTIWVREQMREPFAKSPNLWHMMCTARLFNWIPSLELIMNTTDYPNEWDPDTIRKELRRFKEAGGKVFTSAYMLTGTFGGDKISQVIDKVLTPLWENPPEIVPESLEKTFRNFKGRPGIGGFLAYEIVTDLRHTRYLNRAQDMMTWANAGPGAVRGLNRLHKRPVKSSMSQKEACIQMQELLGMMRSAEIFDRDWEMLEMRDIEHSLCETDKYLRAWSGEGRPKQLFKPNGDR